MSPEKQRIAIAEACGWRWNVKQNDGLWWVYRPDGLGAGMTTEITTDYFFSVFQIPDYLSDLNAMHEAESIFTYEQAEVFYHNLFEVCENSNDTADNTLPSIFAVITATASQRAEAFLRTINLWTE